MLDLSLWGVGGVTVSRGSSVGVVTRLLAGRSAFRISAEATDSSCLFCTISRPAVGVGGREVNRPGREADSSPSSSARD